MSPASIFGKWTTLEHQRCVMRTGKIKTTGEGRSPALLVPKKTFVPLHVAIGAGAGRGRGPILAGYSFRKVALSTFRSVMCRRRLGSSGQPNKEFLVKNQGLIRLEFTEGSTSARNLLQS